MFDEAQLTDHALMQDPAFAKALNLCGQDPVHLPGGELVLVRRIAGIRVAMLPRAVPPLALSEALTAVGLQRAPLIISPDHLVPLPRCLRLRAPAPLAILPLRGTAQTRRMRLHPKWRNQLKRAEKTALNVRHCALEADPDGDLLRTEVRQAKARGYANWPAPLTAAFARAAPNQTHLFRATLHRQVVARMLFLSHGRRATYHIGQITPLGKTVCAHNLLMWRAMAYLSAHGCQSIDLGRLHAATPGLNRFKVRTGATSQLTGGTHLFWRPFARA